MAFDTTFNILWNQRVNKEETALLKFLDKRKQDEEPKKRESKRASQRAMSDADLMSAVKSVRSDASASLTRSRSEAKQGRSRGSAASSSVLKNAGSSMSSPTGRRKAAGMTFEQQQEHVYNAYMNKYIKDLEKEAKEAAVENQWTAQKIKDGMQQEVDEKSKARQLAAENQRQLMEQIEENKQRRANTRKQFVEAASAHNFPLFTETFISQEEVDKYRKDVKVNYREELELQHTTTKTLRNMLQKKDRLFAEEKLATCIKKMEEDHAQDHKDNVRKGKEMHRVWDRDIRLKNIKNAILSGKDATQMQVA